jgi:hypothetical protein
MAALDLKTPGSWFFLAVLSILTYCIAALMLGGIIQGCHRLHIIIEAYLHRRRRQKIVVPEPYQTENVNNHRADEIAVDRRTTGRDVFGAL